MTKFETLFCAALSNSAICTGNASARELDIWFPDRISGITREEIATRQAAEYAKQALKYLERLSG